MPSDLLNIYQDAYRSLTNQKKFKNRIQIIIMYKQKIDQVS